MDCTALNAFMKKLITLILLVGLAILAAVSLGASPAPAQATWSVNVTSDLVTVSFPDSITFDLELTSSVPVNEVTVYYKLVGQDITSYDYPELKQGITARATYTLHTTGLDYVPPGVDIEYYYALRDGQGRVNETPHKSFTYEDPRFTWYKTRIGSLELLWHGGLQSEMAGLKPGLETALARMESLLQITPESPLRGVIYNSYQEAAAAFPHVSAALQQEQLFAGYAFPDKGVFVGVGMQHYLIAHESAHLYTGLLLGPATSLLPTWVEEGLAVYMQSPNQSYESLRAAVKGNGDLLPLKAMETLPGKAEQIRLFYAEAPVVVAYLIEKHGDERFRRFLLQFEKGATVDEALLRAYGFGVETLDKQWRGASGGRFAFDVQFWAVLLPAVLTALLIVLVTTVTLIRFIRRSRQDEDTS
jgi:hypothetical protein